MKKKQSNQLRIIGGSHKRSIISFVDGEGLRPTPDRVRETLFNWLGQDLTGLIVLDLFAGSGALGFESSSRGAKNIYLVDSNRAAVQMLNQNQQRLELENLNIICSDALSFLNRCQVKFDVVFLDPPFVFKEWEVVFSALKPNIVQGAYIYLESPCLPELPIDFHVVKSGQAGQSKQWLLQYRLN